MSEDREHRESVRWRLFVEKFEEVTVVALAFLLILIVAIILLVAFYVFATKAWSVMSSVEDISDLQQAALRAFSGVLLVLLGLELLDTVKTYFLQRSLRVEVILLVGLIAMGRHVLEIDLHHIDPMILFGFSSLILGLAASYFLVKRAGQWSLEAKRPPGEEDGIGTATVR
jgi:uncharacterized membrane protein (DUF373 family)